MDSFKHHPNRCTESCEDGEGHCYPCIVYSEGIAEGRKLERADVVARLRREFNDLTLDGQTVDAIAAGHHEGDAKYAAEGGK